MLRKLLFTLSLILGLPAILCTLLAFSRNEHWFFRLCDFPRLQVILFLLISITLVLYSRTGNPKLRYSLVILAALCACYQVFKVIPYTTLHGFEVRPYTDTDPGNHLSVVYSNVYMTNRNSEDALREMNKYDPDMILAVETDQWWAEQLKVLKKKYPYSLEMPLDNTYGMILYSRLPLENTDFQYLVNEEVPSLQPVITLPSGQKIQAYFIHPKPPAPQEAPSSKQRDKELIIVAKSAKATNLPVLVAGDLNDVGWSYTSELFQETSGLLDPRIGRGFYSTFNAKYPFFRWPLDHVFTSREFRVVELQRLGFMGSDHFPIYFKLSYEPEKKAGNKTRTLEKDDLENANKKLNQKTD